MNQWALIDLFEHLSLIRLLNKFNILLINI